MNLFLYLTFQRRLHCLSNGLCQLIHIFIWWQVMRHILQTVVVPVLYFQLLNLKLADVLNLGNYARLNVTKLTISRKLISWFASDEYLASGILWTVAFVCVNTADYQVGYRHKKPHRQQYLQSEPSSLQLFQCLTVLEKNICSVQKVFLELVFRYGAG